MENKGIYIEFLGKAHCHWTEGSGSKKETYSGSETYLEERQYLLGNHNGELLYAWPNLFIVLYCVFSASQYFE